MKVTLVAPIEETVPPVAYGGIEQVVHFLDHDLVARGNDVTLLASGGSSAASRLVPLAAKALGRPCSDDEVRCFSALKNQAAQRAAAIIADEKPDIVLNHSWHLLDYLQTNRSVTTVHFPLDVDPYRSIFFARKSATYVAVSNAQRLCARDLRFAGTVYNGIDVAALPYSAKRGTYLAFLGRMSPQKGLDIAIRVAQKVGIPLKVAAKLDIAERPWYHDVIAPLLRRGGVELVGEIAVRDKGALLAGALALLHPSRWSEPFGLAAVEAMACGTPVLMLNRGAAAEIVEDGRTGFVVNDEGALASAVEGLERIERSACRQHVASRFDRRMMAEHYEQIALQARDNQ